MGDQLPIKFVIPNEGIIASYDAVDIINGTGYATLYAGGTIDTYPLSNVQYYASPKSSSGSLSSTNLDRDFDITINKTMTLYGKAIVTVQEYISLGSDNGSCSFTFYLRYVPRGGSETQIATNAGSTFNGTPSTVVYRGECIDLPITSKITLKKGDILRLTVTGTGTTGGSPAGNRYFGICHDPANRTAGSAEFTELKLLLPMVVEL